MNVPYLHQFKKQARPPQDSAKGLWLLQQKQICETAPEFLTFLDKLDSPQCVTEVDSVLGDTKKGHGARPSVCEKPRVR